MFKFRFICCYDALQVVEHPAIRPGSKAEKLLQKAIASAPKPKKKKGKEAAPAEEAQEEPVMTTTTVTAQPAPAEEDEFPPPKLPPLEPVDPFHCELSLADEENMFFHTGKQCGLPTRRLMLR